MLKRLLRNQPRETKQITATAIALLIAIMGTIMLNGSHAATPYASVTAHSGNTNSGASVNSNCTNSTDGSCVVFNGTTSGARGRPTIVNNTLVSDQGTLLRGGTLW